MKKLIAVLFAIFILSGCTGATPESTMEESTPEDSTDVTMESTEGMEEVATEYTLDDVAMHATQEDCWMAVGGKVYNITPAIETHPGGEAILRGCGKENTENFTNIHSEKEGIDMKLEGLYIGNLK